MNVLFVLWLAFGIFPAKANECTYTARLTIDCTFAGEAQAGSVRRVSAPAQVLYVYVGRDEGGEQCYYFSTRPHEAGSFAAPVDGLEGWLVANLPRCDRAVVDPGAEAWEVFTRLPLEAPEPSLHPPGSGITGLETLLSDEVDAPTVRWAGTLPSGVEAEVEGRLAGVVVSWGDGTAAGYDPAALAAGGAAGHVYQLKTCTAAYRASHPRGHLCHPTLEAYPVEVVFTWEGRYRVDGGWVELGEIDLAATVDYDVDEVIGVLTAQ